MKFHIFLNYISYIFNCIKFTFPTKHIPAKNYEAYSYHPKVTLM